jgi:iron complex outermembrane receptor protein
VKSGFVELLVPIIGEGNALPLVQALDLNLSGRYDNYSDFGSTKNPKIAVNWTMTDGVKLRGNWAKSFVAPAFTSIGSGGGITGESAMAAMASGGQRAGRGLSDGAQLPGCAAATTCSLGTTITGAAERRQRPTAAATRQELGGGRRFQPRLPARLPRQRHLLEQSKLTGGITSPIPALAVNSSGLNSLLKIYPNGATPAQIAAAAWVRCPRPALSRRRSTSSMTIVSATY